MFYSPSCLRSPVPLVPNMGLESAGKVRPMIRFDVLLLLLPVACFPLLFLLPVLLAVATSAPESVHVAPDWPESVHVAPAHKARQYSAQSTAVGVTTCSCLRFNNKYYRKQSASQPVVVCDNIYY